MSTFTTMQMALSGIRAQSRAMEDISGNIANVRTTAFKRFDTSFAEMVSALSSTSQPAPGGVTTRTRANSLIVGEIQNTGSKTAMALNGEGFFPVRAGDGSAAYTRRGDFAVADAGAGLLQLVNGAGLALKPDKEENTLPITINRNATQRGAATSEVTYKLNLPSVPKTALYDPTVPGSELLAPELSRDITGADLGAFLQQTVVGGSLPIHNEGGDQLALEFRWGKLSGAPDGDKWALFYLSDKGAVDGQPIWSKAGEYEFTDNQLSGVLDQTGAQSPLTGLQIANLMVEGEAIGPVRLVHGNGGVTQFADSRGTPVPTALSQNGYPPGVHQEVSIGPEGQVMQLFTNGRSEEIGRVQLYNFANPDALERGSGGELRWREEAGGPKEISSNKLVTGAIEGSNIDLPHEFSMLILTQQAYSASTRVISAADDMMKGALDELR